MALEDKLRQTFNQAVEEWKKHCLQNAHHSMVQFFLNCDAYRQIVRMGVKILPLIRDEYSKPQKIGDPGMRWCYVIKNIVPEFNLSVEEKGSGSPVERVAPGFIGLRVDEVQKAAVKWLDENMHRYIGKK